MSCKDRLETYLRENAVPFEIQHHPRAYTAQEVAATEHLPGKRVAKVVIILADEKPLMLALPASYRVELSKIGPELGVANVRLAQEREFAASFPDCEIGAMPPFGNLYGVPVLVDMSLAEEERIVFQAGTHTDTMSVSYVDYGRLVKPRVAHFAYRS